MEAWPSWAAGRMANLLLRFKQGIFGNDPLANYQESQQPPATHPFPTFSTSKTIKKTKERTDDPCPGADAKILSQPVPGEKHTECLWFHKQDSRNGLV